MKRDLSTLQTAALLVSASYGIGFLFGSGELALRWGMAGSLYAVATALGMLALALWAPRLWRARLPVWDLLGTAYGRAAAAGAALLSLLWMCGVLSAQLQGGMAVLRVAGVGDGLAWALVGLLVVVVTQLQLATAARVFSASLLASNAILVWALWRYDGFTVYFGALSMFAADLARVPGTQVLVVLLAVVTLVMTGADYQQFVIASRNTRAAARGCVLAAAFLLVCGFLPASVVVAFVAADGPLPADAALIVPHIMSRVASDHSQWLTGLLLLSLLGAALGSAAAITRAMAGAVVATMPSLQRLPGTVLVLLVLACGAAVTARGQAIVATMVSLNIVYIAAVSVALAASLGGWALSPAAARASMLAGGATALALYAWGWLTGPAASGDLASLAAGLAAAAAAAVFTLLRRRACAAPATVAPVPPPGA